MRILLTAEPFNLGPISKLLAIHGYLKEKTRKDCIYSFFGEKIAYKFAKENAEFDNYYYIKNHESYKLIQKLKPDLLISVMDPWSIFYSYYLKIPAITFDSLFWKWSINDINRYKDFLIALEKNKLRQTKNLFSNLKIHDKHIVAAMLSKKTYVQNFPTIEQNIKILKPVYNKIIKCNIIDLRFVKEVIKRKEDVIINYGGLESPHFDSKKACLYDTLINKLFQLSIQKRSNLKFVKAFYGRRIKSKFIENKMFTHEEFLKKLNSSVILFSQPGLTTMMEAFFYKIPLILLPEKHHTQRICYDIFERYGLKLPTLFLSERIDRCQESKSKTDGIYTNYQNIINNQFLTNRVSKKLLNFIDIYSDEKNAKELTKSQMKFIKKYRCADLTNVVDQIINEFL